MVLQTLYGILFPALAAGITWGIAWRIWSRSAPPIAAGTWAGALAIGLAMIVGFLGNEGWPGFPPARMIGWVLFIAFAAGLAGLFEHSSPRSFLARSFSWLVLGCAVVWILTSTPRSTWKGVEFFLWCAGLMAGTGIVIAATEPLAERWLGASIPLALWVWSAGIAVALAVTGSLTYGHLAGVLAAAMGAGVVAAWIKPTISFARGAASALILLGMSFLLCGYFYSDLPASSALILAAAPLALWIGETPIVVRRKPWLAVLLRAAFIALPVAAALLIAAWPMIFPKPSAGAPGNSAEDNFYK